MTCFPRFPVQRWLPLAASLLMLPSAAVLAGPVNINTADAATLAQELKGIGLKRAQAIVDYRAKHGPFKSPDELSLIKGIGTKVIQRNRADIRLSGSAAAAAVAPAGRQAAAAPSAAPVRR